MAKEQREGMFWADGPDLPLDNDGIHVTVHFSSS